MEKEKISGIKQQCFSSIDSRADAIFELGRALFAHPELGFKEFETKRLLLEFLTKEGFTVQQEYARTGFQISIGSGHPHIALIAEMDAIPTPGHPMANHADQEAAHSCGHSSQCAIAVAALLALKDSKAVADGGMVSLFFTPAEEYTDMEFRKELIAKGEIQYPAGKIQMLADGVLKDVDVCLHMHAMGESKYHFAVDSSLAGFIYKKFIFHGRGAHAAVLPHLGVNALNAFALFQSAAGMLRETCVDEDKNRFHGIVTEGGQTVNSIPERVVYEGYVRSFNTEQMQQLSNRLTNAASHCAMAIGGTCEVEDTPGYLPFHPCHALSEVAHQNMLAFVPEEAILKDEKSVAAGDIGDLGAFIPCIQFGYGGITGIIHGKSMQIADEPRVYLETAKILAATAVDLLQQTGLMEHICGAFQPEMTWEEYEAYCGAEFGG